MQPYERFEAWQQCHALVLAVYRCTKRFPPEERYGLVSQSRRAAYSAAANTVEGSARSGPREFRRFLCIPVSSLAELGYALRLAHGLDYLSDDDWHTLEQQRVRAAQLTWGLFKSLGEGN